MTSFSRKTLRKKVPKMEETQASSVLFWKVLLSEKLAGIVTSK